MLKTEGNITQVLRGIDTQDFEQIQLVQGAFPYQAGLQQRLPGKTLQRSLSFPIGSIYAFYNVYGRNYRFLDYGLIEIEEVVVEPINLPPLPPVRTVWFDDFEAYPDDLISKFWGAGEWRDFVGICETLISGFIDAFAISATIISVPIPLDATLTPIRVTSIPEPAEDTQQRIKTRIPKTCENPNLPPSEIPYTLVPLESIISLVQRYAGITTCNFGNVGSECVVDELPTWSAPPAFAGYDATPAGGGLSITLSRMARTAFTGFAWQRRHRTEITYTQLYFDLTSVPLPLRARIYLVGTKTESDGNTNTSQRSECAVMQLNYAGQLKGSQELFSATTGTSFSQVALNQESLVTQLDSVVFPEVRIYDYTNF